MNFDTPKRDSQKRTRVIRLLFLVGMAIAALVFAITPRITVVICAVGGETQECPESVIAEFEQYKGKSYWFLHVEKSIQKTQSAMPDIATVTARTYFPNRLWVYLEPSRNLFEISVVSGQEQHRYLVDKNGTFREIHDAQFRVQFVIEKENAIVQNGKLDEESVQQFAAIASALGSQSYERNPIRFHSPDELVYQINENTTAITTLKDGAAQLSSLQDILHDGTMNFQGKIIDLRFQRPVVR